MASRKKKSEKNIKTPEDKNSFLLEKFGNNEKGINLSSPDGFFWLWNIVNKDENFFKEFLGWCVNTNVIAPNEMILAIVNPERFASALYNFCQQKKSLT